MSQAKKAYAAVAEGKEERRIPREPIKLGNNHRGLGDLGQMQRLCQFRPVGPVVALDLGETGQHLCAARDSKVVDGLALCLKPQPARPLARGRDPLISTSLAPGFDATAKPVP
jgi:hypothetical protein